MVLGLATHVCSHLHTRAQHTALVQRLATHMTGVPPKLMAVASMWPVSGAIVILSVPERRKLIRKLKDLVAESLKKSEGKKLTKKEKREMHEIEKQAVNKIDKEAD